MYVLITERSPPTSSSERASPHPCAPTAPALVRCSERGPGIFDKEHEAWQFMRRVGIIWRRRSGGNQPTCSTAADCINSLRGEPLLSGRWTRTLGVVPHQRAAIVSTRDITSPGSWFGCEKRAVPRSGRGGQDVAYNLIHFWQRGGSDGGVSSSFIQRNRSSTLLK